MKILIFIVLFLIQIRSNSQERNNANLITNEGFVYKIGRTSLKILDSFYVVPSMYVVLSFLPDSVRKVINDFSSKDWILLLENPNSDWAANLLLFEKYNMDATEFKIIKTRKEWLGTKNRAIKYWKNKFKMEAKD